MTRGVSSFLSVEPWALGVEGAQLVLVPLRLAHSLCVELADSSDSDPGSVWAGSSPMEGELMAQGLCWSSGCNPKGD